MNGEKVQEIHVEDIIPNRFQPRLTFDEEALQELADSIKVHGVIQPLVLRQIGNKYEIIAGERRYKASCLAGLKTVPAIVREMNDNESAEVALIENVQRKNLTSIEEAQSYKNLLDRGYLTQSDLANKIGVSQPSIANKMRLLNLCDEVQNALLNEKISERHARSLLALENPDDQKKMLDRIIKERLTVKQLDNEIKKKLNNETDESDEESGGSVLEPIQDNSIPQEPYRNIFGVALETPTDLEVTAPNLDTSIDDSIPPVSFNPFMPMQEENKTEEIETFDMFDSSDFEKQPESLISDEKEVTATTSVGDQIINIRNAIHDVEKNGFVVEMEEYDFEDVYQFVIKIKK